MEVVPMIAAMVVDDGAKREAETGIDPPEYDALAAEVGPVVNDGFAEGT
jgi:hypothetical protein